MILYPHAVCVFPAQQQCVNILIKQHFLSSAEEAVCFSFMIFSEI